MINTILQIKDFFLTWFPNLRFREFTDEWEVKKLGELGEIITGTTPSTKNNNYYGGNYLFVSPADINNYRFVIDTRTKLTKQGFEKGRIIKERSTLFVCIGSTIGKVAQNKIDCITNQQINSIVSNKYNCDNFIFSLLEFHSKKIKQLSGEQAVPIINKSTFSKYKVKLPTLNEQTKIAKFLIELDKRISTQRELIEELEKQIKGCRQRLFSQEIRFKDNNENDFKEWQTEKLSNICKIVKGQQFSKEKLILNSEYPYLNGGVNPSGYSEKFNTDKDTITISEGGNSCGYVNYLETKFWCGGHCYSLLDVEKEVNVIFLYQLLKFQEKKIMMLRVGSGLPNIQKKDISNYKILIPFLEEQTKIANFLSALDNKLKAEKDLLKEYENQKKYFLQNMFV